MKTLEIVITVDIKENAEKISNKIIGKISKIVTKYGKGSMKSRIIEFKKVE